MITQHNMTTSYIEYNMNNTILGNTSIVRLF